MRWHKLSSGKPPDWGIVVWVKYRYQGGLYTVLGCIDYFGAWMSFDEHYIEGEDCKVVAWIELEDPPEYKESED